MLKYFGCIAICISVISCNDNKVPATESATDTLTGSVKINDTNITAAPLSLAPSETKDDSVFTDGSIPTSWENAGFTDVHGFKLFLKQVQLWVMNNDKEKIASVVQYPLKKIRTKEELLQQFDSVFTKKVKLSFATIHFNQIFRNAEGAMTGNGEVWFAQKGKDLK